ncbi:hypothetical protein HanRHA438_Chr17g0817061 [Helianthus annuus]|nr:hypothetical protein HanRHA438_Chr17g0817061 [Helianthus annuus]
MRFRGVKCQLLKVQVKELGEPKPAVSYGGLGVAYDRGVQLQRYQNLDTVTYGSSLVTYSWRVLVSTAIVNRNLQSRDHRLRRAVDVRAC